MLADGNESSQDGKKQTKPNRRLLNGIDVLPGDVLLEIFYLYVNMNVSYERRRGIEAWQSLVHVCRRWRSLVFYSPRRLNLHLCCTPQTPIKDTLDVWPAFPLVVRGDITSSSDADNVSAALEQCKRVRRVNLGISGDWNSEKGLATMQVSFPELTDLQFYSIGQTPPILPDSLLDASAPSLQDVFLSGVSFPGLPKLLPSATHLATLKLYNVPHSGYISPEAMAAPITSLSSLRTFILRFHSPQSRPDRENRRRLPPPKRSILPVLERFHFKGDIDYLEQLVTHIDAPQLDEIDITLFNQIDFDCPRLAQFVNRTPTLGALDEEARVQFDDSTASVILRDRVSQYGLEHLRLTIPCGERDWQLSAIEQVCNASLRPFSAVEDLYIERRFIYHFRENNVIEDALWLQLLLPFTRVKNLYLSDAFAPGIAAGLQELAGDRITAVLPSLRTIFVEKLKPSAMRRFHENIGRFVAARRLSNRPIVISDWRKYL